MLKKIQYLLMIGGLIFIASCHENLGNYDYNDINEVQFEGIEEEYSILMGDHFTLEPVLKFTEDNSGSEERYEYEWFAINKAGVLPGEKRKDLATTRNLDMPITLAPSTYEIFYR